MGKKGEWKKGWETGGEDIGNWHANGMQCQVMSCKKRARLTWIDSWWTELIAAHKTEGNNSKRRLICHLHGKHGQVLAAVKQNAKFGSTCIQICSSWAGCRVSVTTVRRLWMGFWTVVWMPCYFAKHLPHLFTTESHTSGAKHGGATCECFSFGRGQMKSNGIADEWKRRIYHGRRQCAFDDISVQMTCVVDVTTWQWGLPITCVL